MEHRVHLQPFKEPEEEEKEIQAIEDHQLLADDAVDEPCEGACGHGCFKTPAHIID